MIALRLITDVNIVIEPGRRDMFTVITLVCIYLYSEKGVIEDEIILVLPVDPYEDIDYFKKTSKIEDILEEDGATDLVLLDAVPTSPTEKYGYFMPGEEKSLAYQVKYFKEKPNTAKAQQLIKQGALLNGGVFGLKSDMC